MPDRDKVIYDIERCVCHVPDACKDCSKYGGDNVIRCMEELLTDALDLLKAQEPVKAYRLHGEKVIDNGGKVFIGQCSNCFCYLVDGWKACPVCGKAVKWDA